MKKTYWVMKTPHSTADWIEMTGKQFYDFITSPEAKGRFFMDCDTYKIEVSPEQYRQWKLEQNHSHYLHEFEEEILILSLQGLSGDGHGDDLVADPTVNIEDEVIGNIDLQELSKAILSLTDGEKWLVFELFMRDKPKTEQEIATLTGVTQQAVHKQKNKILNKLKLLVVKSQKSQQ